MSRIVYVNGAYLPEDKAKVSVFDRGFLFADAVYEVTCVLNGKLVDFEGHAARLERSLKELNIRQPVTRDKLQEVHHQLIERNRVEMGGVYLQISRGQAPDRDFAYPAEGVAPTVVLFTQEKTGVADQAARDSGLKVITIEDQRWGRCDIKTVQLLYPSMAKMMAQASGAQDAWLTRGGAVTEGTANNAYIVKNGVIITRNLGNDILPGVTRRAVLRMAEEHGLAVEERAFTVEEAYAADEAFATASVLLVKPVVEIDGNKIGQGIPGPVTCALRATCIDEALRATIG